MELVVFIGLQGSGKSSFYRARFAASHVHVSKDRMRNNRNRARRQRELVEAALRAGSSVVVDNTNPRIADREELIQLGRKLGAEIVGYYFDADLQECLTRNRTRTGKERVPDVALFVTRSKLTPPSHREGFDRLYSVRVVGESQVDVSEWGEPAPVAPPA
jgi:predicted kinase